MKNKILICMLLLCVLFFSKCEKLDYVPADQLSNGVFWKTEAQAKQAAVGLYQAMKQPWCFGMEFTFEMASDLANGASPWTDISRGVSFSSRSAGVQKHFQALYELVHRSNTVIRNVANMDISKTTIDQIIGEAKFLRALAYFRLLNAWGGVPYYDESTDINEAYATVTNPKSTEEEIRAHIIEDLTEAIQKLPVKWEDSDYGQATKGAAYALRGKVYLFNKEWTKAISDFEEIVNNKSEEYGYALNDSYEDLFRLYNGKRSKEMIFSIQSIDGNVAGYALDIVSYFGNKSTMRLIASNLIVPSTTLVDKYENKDGSKFNWDDVYPGFKTGSSAFRRGKLSVAIDQGSTVITSTLNADTAKIRKVYTNRDPRLEWNVITPYSHYLGTDAASVPKDKQFVLADASKGGAPMEAFAFMRNSEGWNSYFWRKWIPTGNLNGYWGEFTRTPYEFPLIRLGDVILMLAEAYNENGELSKAIIEVNKIRSRVQMPGLNTGTSWLAVNSKDEMTQRIRDERAFELAGEGQRYWDIRRWGILKSTVTNATDIFGDLMYERKYQARQEIWPFPLIELERNTNLVQNPNW